MATAPSKPSSEEVEGQSTDTSDDEYQYTKLPTPHSTRLVELHPSESEDVIVTLRTVELDLAPPYEAISYVWGDPNFKVGIKCEGRSLKVTPNLKAVLHHLRPKSRTRILWADAVCINQEDFEERSQQVRIMSKIYSTAIRTLIWLGSNSEDITEAIPLMEKIGNLFCEENSTTLASLRGLDRFHELRQFNIDKLSPFEASKWLQFFDFYENPYFCRTWCIREVGVSKEAIALHGRDAIDFTLIALAANWTSYDPEKMEVIQYMKNDCGIAHARFMGMRDHSNLSLRQLLRSTASFECTDPRDKIYSTLDFGASGRTGWITPDYTKSVVDVFLEAVMQMMKEDGLYFLANIFHHPMMLDDWPSWIPRWNFGSIMPLYPSIYNASGTDDASISERIRYNLKLRGYRVDLVSAAHDVLGWTCFNYTEDFDGRGPLLDLWEENTTGEKATTNYATGENIKTAFSITMVVGFEFNPADFDSYTQNLLVSDNDDPGCPASEDDSNSNPRAYQLLVQQSACNRAFFWTENGYMGLGPRILQPQDQIWVVLGSRLPVALRPKDDFYQVVGACYVHGYMNGEAIQGLKSGTFVEQDVILC
jgi:hypothetical protein